VINSSRDTIIIVIIVMVITIHIMVICIIDIFINCVIVIINLLIVIDIFIVLVSLGHTIPVLNQLETKIISPVLSLCATPILGAPSEVMLTMTTLLANHTPPWHPPHTHNNHLRR